MAAIGTLCSARALSADKGFDCGSFFLRTSHLRLKVRKEHSCKRHGGGVASFGIEASFVESSSWRSLCSAREGERRFFVRNRARTSGGRGNLDRARRDLPSSCFDFVVFFSVVRAPMVRLQHIKKRNPIRILRAVLVNFVDFNEKPSFPLTREIDLQRELSRRMFDARSKKTDASPMSFVFFVFFVSQVPL